MYPIDAAARAIARAMTQHIAVRTTDPFIAQADIVPSATEAAGLTPNDIRMTAVGLRDARTQVPAIKLHKDHVEAW